MKSEAITLCFGIGCLTIIAVACVQKGIDSTVLAATAGSIGAVIGYIAKKKRG